MKTKIPYTLVAIYVYSTTNFVDCHRYSFFDKEVNVDSIVECLRDLNRGYDIASHFKNINTNERFFTITHLSVL